MNLKKTGQLILIVTLIILFATGYMGIHGMWKLTFGAFGLGAACVLIFFGGVEPPDL